MTFWPFSVFYLFVSVFFFARKDTINDASFDGKNDISKTSLKWGFFGKKYFDKVKMLLVRNAPTAR